MLKKILSFLLTAFFVTNVSAEIPDSLTGTWVVDVDLTENSLLNSHPPEDADKLATWCSYSLFYSLYTYEFRDDDATIRSYGSKKTLEYKLHARKGSEIIFVQKQPSSTDSDILTVIRSSDDNIMIFHKTSPEMRGLIWKKGNLVYPQITPEQYKQITDRWMKMQMKVCPYLKDSARH